MSDELSFVPPFEAIERLGVIIEQLEKSLSSEPKFLAAKVYRLALKAQRKILEHLNSESLNCRVLWDNRTNLPSHPSLAADAEKSGELFVESGESRAMLESLSRWATLKKETLGECCCGSGKKRPVTIEIVVNTILGAEEESLKIRLIVGVKCDDKDHLKEHYDFKEVSRASEDIIIIFDCTNRLRVHGDNVSIAAVDYKLAGQFDVDNFAKIIRKAGDCFEESPPLHKATEDKEREAT